MQHLGLRQLQLVPLNKTSAVLGAGHDPTSSNHPEPKNTETFHPILADIYGCKLPTQGGNPIASRSMVCRWRWIRVDATTTTYGSPITRSSDIVGMLGATVERERGVISWGSHQPTWRGTVHCGPGRRPRHTTTTNLGRVLSFGLLESFRPPVRPLSASPTRGGHADGWRRQNYNGASSPHGEQRPTRFLSLAGGGGRRRWLPMRLSTQPRQALILVRDAPQRTVSLPESEGSREWISTGKGLGAGL